MTEGPGAGAGRIVVGVDGSRPSQQALRWGAHLAATFGAGLDAVTAWEFPSTYGFSAVPSDWDPAQDMRKVLDETIQEVFGGQPPAGLRPLAYEGGAAKVLLDGVPGRDHAGGGQPRPRRFHRASAGLGQRERRRARLLPGPGHPRRPGTAHLSPKLSP